METLKDIKSDIYSLLSSVTYTTGEVKVYQSYPRTGAVFPCITFMISNDFPNYSLEPELNYQNIEITIDFWGKDSATTSSMLSEAEAKLRENGYLMQSSIYRVEDNGMSHIYTVFNFIK